MLPPTEAITSEFEPCRASSGSAWRARRDAPGARQPFAFLYNVLGVPVATGLLYPVFGLLLSPMLAGAAMSLSSASVVANALRLRRVRA